MAEHRFSSSLSRQPHRLLLPLMIGGGISVVLTLFTIGYLTLTTPEPVPDDIYTIMQKAKAKSEADKAGNSEDPETAEPDNATLLPDGTFDFAKYSYYSFPLPFVSNLASGKGMLTAEVAIATYGNTLASEKVMKQLETFNPKIRSAINLKLSDQKLSDVDTVDKRNKLAEALLQEVKILVDGPDIDGPSAITDFHFLKFVVSGAQ
ncbi:flagellar basal body-associated FliL family protein [Candidatus Puniceispirillum sp.]|nr:flagellar basal body-associated FliL family protein [Candidatus Puniceispirillum sp.]